LTLYRGAWLCLLLLPLWLSGCDRAPKLEPLTEYSTILAFGDSLTRGTGAEEEESYPGRLQPMLPGTLVVSAVPGETSDRGLSRLKQVLEQTRPELVLLCHGGNDILQKRDLGRTKENLAEMIRLCRKEGAQVVLIGVPRPGLFLSAAELYRELAEEFHIPYEGEALSEILSDNRLKSDLIHPNASGYARMAEAVEAVLFKSGALR